MKKVVWTAMAAMAGLVLTGTAAVAQAPQQPPPVGQAQTQSAPPGTAASTTPGTAKVPNLKKAKSGNASARKLDKQFKKLDANNDGAVSRDEWKGRAKAFARLDTNHDGKLTKDELRARKKK
jgi:hypothetical protein